MPLFGQRFLGAELFVELCPQQQEEKIGGKQQVDGNGRQRRDGETGDRKRPMTVNNK